MRRAEIKAGTNILKFHMFVIEKYLVADGRGQDTEMYPDKSSLTVAVHSVFTVLGVASGKPWQVVMKIDIKSAFVQMPMKGEPIYIMIDCKMSKYGAIQGRRKIVLSQHEVLCQEAARRGRCNSEGISRKPQINMLMKIC
jgi:hypothetical protein